MQKPSTGDDDRGDTQDAHPASGSGGRLWGGRAVSPPDASLEILNRSLSVDRRLWREDIEGSVAWSRALAGAGVLSAAEAAELQAGLSRVAARIERGKELDADDEDIHSLVERLLYEEVGEVAGKLHTGRSRNDQVATDFRLWALRATKRLDQELKALQRAILDQAAQNVERVMPAYTHLRRAQPVRVAHWMLAHFWALDRDRARFCDALKRVSVLPLGSGAIAGCPFPVDRGMLANTLGFDALSPNSIDAVSDRDWVVELTFAAALVGVHLSRLAEDLIIYSCEEFGFVRLPDAFTTGSSLLPQKRNPDGLELARGKAARLTGDVAAALAMLKGLPSGYQKDLQEDKTLLFGAFDALLLVLPATRGTVAGLAFSEDALRKAVDDDALLATDMADELVSRGIPFREAHHAVGALLRTAETRGVQVHDIPADEWPALHPAFGSGPVDRPLPEDSVERRTVPGGTARDAVLAQIRTANDSLS